MKTVFDNNLFHHCELILKQKYPDTSICGGWDEEEDRKNPYAPVPLNSSILYDERGNKITEAVDVKLLAKLRFKSTPGLAVDNSLVSSTTICEGFLVRPIKMPPGILTSEIGSGFINGDWFKIKLLLSIQSSVKTVTETTGDRIRLQIIERILMGDAV